MIINKKLFPNQNGFMKGKNVKDSSCITFETINFLFEQVKGGNVGIKIDITKTFDTINWHFLIQVLHCFDFYEGFLMWTFHIF